MRQEYGLIASGTWQTIKAERRKRIPSWSESEARQTILFEFQKNGRIKLYEDKNNNGNPNRKRDILTRGDEFNKSYDKQYYSRKHFSTMSNGKFEIEFEGYENNKGNYEAFYSIRRKIHLVK